MRFNQIKIEIINRVPEMYLKYSLAGFRFEMKSGIIPGFYKNSGAKKVERSDYSDRNTYERKQPNVF